MTNDIKPGRPTKLTPELQEKICRYIAAGNYLSTACQAVDIWPTTFNDWLGKADKERENGGGIYYDFYLATKRAEAEREAVIVQRLIEASGPGERKKVVKTDADGKQSIEVTETGGEWLAAATFLERRHPDRWGRKDRTSVTIDEHKSITITRVTVVLPPGMESPQVIEGEVKELTSGRS
uniref:Terminase n=1 Tax=viral metagenome TaxID=1070528 RepID=A0A6M3J563_9ZZZZ